MIRGVPEDRTRNARARTARPRPCSSSAFPSRRRQIAAFRSGAGDVVVGFDHPNYGHMARDAARRASGARARLRLTSAPRGCSHRQHQDHRIARHLAAAPAETGLPCGWSRLRRHRWPASRSTCRRARRAPGRRAPRSPADHAAALAVAPPLAGYDAILRELTKDPRQIVVALPPWPSRHVARRRVPGIGMAWSRAARPAVAAAAGRLRRLQQQRAAPAGLADVAGLHEIARGRSGSGSVTGGTENSKSGQDGAGGACGGIRACRRARASACCRSSRCGSVGRCGAAATDSAGGPALSGACSPTFDGALSNITMIGVVLGLGVAAARSTRSQPADQTCSRIARARAAAGMC